MLSSISRSLGTAVVIAAMSAGSASAQEAPLSAAESDPNVMGWMQGTPPPADRLITAASPDFFAFPKLRWTVCNIHNLFGTVPTSRGEDTPVPLDYVAPAEFADMRQEIDALSFMPLGGDTTMTFEESLGVNYTDGMLIIHEGEVVYERYSGCLTEDGRHAAMSMTKSTVGLLAEILIAEQRLDENAPVTDYVPELAGSGFETATVRQVMDMTTGIAFDEIYDNPDADIWVYSASGSSAAGAPGYEGPVGYMQYLPLVEQVMEHGAEFGYRTVNTDVLAWVVARVTGMSFNDALSEMLWSRMGAEQNAYFSADVTGTPFAGGGMSASLRDMGRIGLLLLNEGVINGERVFRTRPRRASPAARIRQSSSLPATRPFRAAATARCSGCFTTKTRPTRPAACTGRRSMSIRPPTWCSCAFRPSRNPRTARSIRRRCQPTRRWPTI